MTAADAIDAADPLDTDGPAAPPRSNGELVFTEPWQSRMFATTMRLHEGGRIDWEEFRLGLIDEISIHEKAITSDSAYDYWGCWQRALESLLDRMSIVAKTELTDTAIDLAARPPGHDHDHDGHDHNDHDHHH